MVPTKVDSPPSPDSQRGCQARMVSAKLEDWVPDRASSEARSFAWSFMLGVAILMQDRPCHPRVIGAFKRLLKSAIEAQDMLGLISAMSDIRSELVQKGSWTRAVFKRQQRWVQGVSAAIEHVVDPNCIIHPSHSFDVVVTFLGWLKRLPVCVRDTQLSIQEYYKEEERISSINFDENVYVPQLAGIWRSWFESFKLEDPFLPRHGSGSTADCGKVRAHKWRGLKADAVARVCFRYPTLEPALTIPIGNANRVAKVVFVPKQAGKDRTICMEPAWLQYLQQGVARQLIRYTHRTHHPMSLLVNVFDQSINRRLCAQAWLQGYATIDLTNASDSVSWRLIKRLCKGLPLGRFLYGSRSCSALIGEDTIALDKYAPMGSALCFPIECMLFASVVELAHRMHYGKASRGHHSGCSVYGDDIICPSEIYHLVCEILESLGFVVNQSKSYVLGGYYESCGVEYLYGARINAIRHPRSHLLLKEIASPDDVGMITDVANTLLGFGSIDARRMLLLRCKNSTVRIRNRYLPFMDVCRFDADNIISIQDDYRPSHWNSDLQCSGRYQTSIECSSGSTRYDLHEWKSQNVPRTRKERLFRGFLPKEVHEKWSLKAITFLSRFHYWDLLQEGEINDVGVCRTGRLHHRVTKKFVPVGIKPA